MSHPLLRVLDSPFAFRSSATYLKVRGWLWILAPLLLGLAYGQRALFCSNQHTKFVIGLAQAGYGYLNEDWFASTTDPFPIFSALVAFLWRTFGPLSFYGLFVLLVALSMGSALAIADRLLPQENHKTLLPLFGVLFFLLHAHPIRCRIHEYFPGGFGQQYLLGAYLEPAGFGVMAFLGVAFYLHRFYLLASLSTALAAVFHPAYLIPASIFVLTFFLASLTASNLPSSRLRTLIVNSLGLLLFLMVVMPITLYLNQPFGSTNPTLHQEALAALVHERIPQHAWIQHWPLGQSLAVSILILGGVVSAWNTPMRLLLSVPTLVTALTIFVAWLYPNDRLAMVAPWRLSVFLTPLSVIVILLQGSRSLSRVVSRSGIEMWRGKLFCLIGMVGFALYGIAATCQDRFEQDRDPAQPLYTFVRSIARSGQVYLVPLQMCAFRLETGSPVVVTWKSHPTRAEEFWEWRKRVKDVQAFYTASAEERARLLPHLCQKYGVTHLVLPASEVEWSHSLGKCLFHDAAFLLLEVRGGKARREHGEE